MTHFSNNFVSDVYTTFSFIFDTSTPTATALSCGYFPGVFHSLFYSLKVDFGPGLARISTKDTGNASPVVQKYLRGEYPHDKAQNIIESKCWLFLKHPPLVPAQAWKK